MRPYYNYLWDTRWSRTLSS